jgi:hypothetical protein
METTGLWCPESGFRVRCLSGIRQFFRTLNCVCLVCRLGAGCYAQTVPVPSREALPDITRLLTEIQENQRAIEAALESYTYLKTEEETDEDNQSRVTGKHQAEYEVFYVEGREIEKLRSKNGTVLNAIEQRKEDERTKKLVAKYEQNPKAGSGRVHDNEKDDENNNEDELHVSVFLRACKFTNPRHDKLG